MWGLSKKACRLWVLLIVWIILPYITGSELERRQCRLPVSVPPMFFRRNRTMYFFDDSLRECALADFPFKFDNIVISPSPNRTDHHDLAPETYNRTTVVSFGDSIELSICNLVKSPDMLVSSNHEVSLQICRRNKSNGDSRIFYGFVRLFASNGGFKHSVWTISERSYRNAIPIYAKNWRAISFEPKFILYGSFLWDLLGDYSSYCSKNASATIKTRDGGNLSICSRDKDIQPHISDYQAISFWGMAELPWCVDDSVEVWIRRYLNTIDVFLHQFPNTRLILRTQPINSEIFIGNRYCFEPWNKFVRKLVTLRTEDYWEYRKLTIPYPSYISGKDRRLFYLIDSEALMTAAGPSYATTDHIHYNGDGQVILRLYYERVVLEILDLEKSQQ